MKQFRGEKLKKGIYKSGLSISEFCDDIGISRYTIISYCNGKSKKLRGDTISRIAVGLGVPYEEVESWL